MNPQAPVLVRSSFFKKRAGFSLIEVSIAIAVVAVAVVSLMGLLPAGLGQFQKAMDSTLAAQISQRVISDAEQADFDELIPTAASGEFFVLPFRYFDAQGLEVPVSGSGQPSPSEKIRIVYQVRVRGTFPATGDGTTGGSRLASLPGSPRFSPRSSTFLTIQVAHNPELRELPVENELWKPRSAPIQTFNVVITRAGYKRTRS